MLMNARAASMLPGGRTVPFVMMPRAYPQGEKCTTKEL